MQFIREREMPFRSGHSGVKYLGRGPRIDWGVILLFPGEALGGHYHEQVEETFYILEGTGLFTINGAAHTVAAGDVLRMEANDQHAVRNDGTTALRLIFIKCPYLPQDKVDIP